MKKNIRVNISISPSVLEDAKAIANERFAGNVSAYISSLIDSDIKQRGFSANNPIQIEGTIIDSAVGTNNRVRINKTIIKNR